MPDDHLVRLRRCPQGLFDKAEEQLAAVSRFAAIEAESEFIQVILQMLVADTALVGSEEPAFQERDHSVHARQQSGSLLGVFASASNLVIVACFLKPGVADPAIGMH